VSGEAWLGLADGSAFRGDAFGARADAGGEVVFHTGMTGYQEILTDPSYAGQIVCMTYPEIGNTGTTPEDDESARVWLAGFVVRDHVDFPSSWRSRESLHRYLERHGVPGISGIDTRALVRRIRKTGALNGVLAHGPADAEELRARVRALPNMDGLNLVDGVTCAAPYRWTEGKTWGAAPKPIAGPRYHVVAYDYGVKRNILRELVSAGFEVTVVPAKTSAREALALRPDGIFLSNGPGDPRAVDYAIATTAELVRRKPVFGICLGHQILGLALGGRVRKLRFGHHGANQPAKDLTNGRVWIASENHGFAVDMDSLAHDPEIEVTHLNLNDRTVEGLRHRRWPLFSVQYHPEAAPGPHDASYLFARFRALVEASVAPAR
jgi:carbamoyl-phosphate synthase small subunit